MELRSFTFGKLRRSDPLCNNNGRYAKSLSNLILVDVLFGRVQEALIRSEII